jgi:alpha-tubulin suppressor-like RCC1 family protein
VAVSGGQRFVALAAGSTFTCGLTTARVVFCWGFGFASTPASVTGTLPMTRLVAGNGHACALATDQRLHCWGTNASGQLGDGTLTNSTQTTPVQVTGGTAFVGAGAGVWTTCGVASNGAASCWGGRGWVHRLGRGARPFGRPRWVEERDAAVEQPDEAAAEAAADVQPGDRHGSPNRLI